MDMCVHSILDYKARSWSQPLTVADVVSHLSPQSDSVSRLVKIPGIVTAAAKPRVRP